jgi:putative ABC transport system substrate-binding protein
VKRREFITLFGGAAVVWPLTAHGQQPAMPVVGFLATTSMAANAPFVAAFRQGLKENGYVEGQNVTIEFRWGDAQIDRLQGFAADLVNRPVAVMFAGGPPAALAAKVATTKIPIVFTSGDDPIKMGLVSSLGRPGANVTGVSLLFRELEAKRLEILRELIPGARAVGLLVDSNASSEEAETAARGLGLNFHAAPVATEAQLDAAFSSLADQRVDMILVGSSPRLFPWRHRIIRLAARHSLPAIYELRQYVVDEGLISYGASVPDAYRQAGTYVAKILKGEDPSDLPVVQPTKFDLVINQKMAKTLGLDVPPTLLARADEVIE